MELILQPPTRIHARAVSRRKACAAFGSGLVSLALGLAIVFMVGLSSPVGASPDEAVLDRFAGNVASTIDTHTARSGLSLPPVGPELARFDSRHFLEDRWALMEALLELRDGLISASRPTPEEADLLLDLSALYLSQRMLPEARSFLAAVPDAAAGQAHNFSRQAERRAALDAALLGFDTAMTTAPDGWVDAPLFDALHFIARGEHDAARPLLASAKTVLDGYPAVLADAASLQLFWSAIETGTWGVARVLAARLESESDTRHSAGYRYLLGRAAEVGGDPVAAFDNYAAAGAGSDEWAQRARLALIDLSRSAGALPPESARRLLMQTRALWSGGALALATLQRLAELEMAEQRDLPALDALGDIIWLHPGTRDAEVAAVQADALIDALYTRGLAGEMPFVDLIAAHRAIGRDYGHRDVFNTFAEPFADYLAESGASGLAAAEYSVIRARTDARAAQMAIDPHTEPASVTALQLVQDRLRLKHAAALMQGGQLTEAEALLDIAAAAPESPFHDQYFLMRAQLFAMTQRPSDVLRTRMIVPDNAYLRLRAEAAFALGDWAEARGAYETLMVRTGPGMETRDRINLLLAAYRDGGSDRVRELINTFPDLDEQWTALAARLIPDTPEVFPLRDSAAWQRVGNADAALRQLQETGMGAIP